MWPFYLNEILDHNFASSMLENIPFNAEKKITQSSVCCRCCAVSSLLYSLLVMSLVNNTCRTCSKLNGRLFLEKDPHFAPTVYCWTDGLASWRRKIFLICTHNVDHFRYAFISSAGCSCISPEDPVQNRQLIVPLSLP